jgi:probable HAF family extracellular repeat protein
MIKLLKYVGLLSLLLVSASPALAGVSYTVTNLGLFNPMGMNSQGEVAGWTEVGPSAQFHAVFYSNGVLNDLGTFGGQFARAYGVNDSGQVVGQYQALDGTYHGFLYQNGSVTELNSLIDPNLGLNLLGAEAINNKGQIAGVGQTADGQYRVFLYDKGAVNIYDVPGVFDVTGLNDNGQIAGNFHNQQGYTHGYLLRSGTFADIGTLGGNSSYAYGINSSGTIIGDSTDQNNGTYPFIYEGGKISGIVPPNDMGFAFGINDKGQVVGGSDGIRAFLYESGSITDLNAKIDPALGIRLNGAEFINNNGQIIAASYAGALLLNPIPEPSSLISMIICFYSVFAYFLHRKVRS